MLLLVRCDDPLKDDVTNLILHHIMVSNTDEKLVLKIDMQSCYYKMYTLCAHIYYMSLRNNCLS